MSSEEESAACCDDSNEWEFEDNDPDPCVATSILVAKKVVPSGRKADPPVKTPAKTKMSTATNTSKPKPASSNKQTVVSGTKSKKPSMMKAINVVSPIELKASKRKVKTNVKTNPNHKRAKTTPTASTSPIPMINRNMSGRSFTTTTKDRRHKLFYEVLAPGIVIVYMKKFNMNEEPYLQPLYKMLYDHEDIKNELRVIAAVPRRAADGDTLKQSSKSVYAWKQIMLLIGQPELDENGLETPWEHPPEVTKFLEYFNSPEMQQEFQWPCKAVTGGPPDDCMGASTSNTTNIACPVGRVGTRVSKVL
jgi:hypothetical protein